MGTLELAGTPEDFGLDPQRLARISPHFDAYVADLRLPGWLATVSRGGQLVWRGSGGHRDVAAALPVTDDTVWRIYSMTKPLTSVAVMMLYEEGCFDLFDDVGQWIEALREPRVYVSGSPTSPKTEPATEPVRVHHLLSHLSGLTYGFHYTHPVDAMYRARGYEFASPRDMNLEQVVNDWCSLPLLFQPGSKWNYSVSVDVLGRLIELWSGQSIESFFRERLLDPLGMVDTEWWCPPDKQDRLAMLYVPTRHGAAPHADIAKAATREPAWRGGGGGLVSTAHDYDRFMAFLLNGGELDGVRLLSERTVALMTENHLPDDGDLEKWAVDSFSEEKQAGVGFGLGFSVVVDRRKNKSLVSEGTYGWGGAASTVFWVDPAEELSVAFYTQLLPSSTYNIRRELQQFVYGALTD